MMEPPRRWSALVPREGQPSGDSLLPLPGKGDSHQSSQHQSKGSPEEEGHPCHPSQGHLALLPIQCTENSSLALHQPCTWR